MIRHHPDSDLLMGYARGTLEFGPQLIVACHVECCAVCRGDLVLWDSIGGVLLEAAEPIALAELAFERTFDRVDTKLAPNHERIVPRNLESYHLPRALRKQRIGTRRWVTSNIWFAPIAMRPHSPSLAYLVFARSGTTLSQHAHGGLEYTQVLHGRFRDNLGLFAVGDFAQTDTSILHSPMAEGGSCLCVISSEKPMQLTGRSARILQSLFGSLY